MILLKLKNRTHLPYSDFRDTFENSRKKNPRLRKNIVILDMCPEENTLCIVLGDGSAGGSIPLMECEITSITKHWTETEKAQDDGIQLKLKNGVSLKYPAIRDILHNGLTGNRAYVDSDIVISDVYQEENALCIVFGDKNTGDGAPLMEGEITSITKYWSTAVVFKKRRV